MLAVAAAFGPSWLARIGVGIAVTAAVLACVFAWRELFQARRGHARELLSASQQHGRSLCEERTRNGEVVDTLVRRVAEAGTVVEGQRVVIATLQSEISGLHGEQVNLKNEIAERDTVIGSLRDTVQSRETELRALREEGEETSVRHLPRRVLGAQESAESEVPVDKELWGDSSASSVVDLKMLDTAMVLPNYEVDRRVG